MKKIVIIGPESTGKSTLCMQLAAHYHTRWVPEYAREFLEKNGTQYRYENLYEIALGQVEGEESGVISQESLANSHQSLDISQESIVISHQSLDNSWQTNLNPQHTTPVIFIDTDLYVIKVWSEFVFNKCDNRILTQIAKRKYDLYLLCNTDLPWQADSLREYPDLHTREILYHYYKDAMLNQKTTWADISGMHEERLQKAIEAVNRCLATSKKLLI